MPHAPSTRRGTTPSSGKVWSLRPHPVGFGQALAQEVLARGEKAAVRSVVARFGGIDVLANIAGRGSLGAAEEFAADELRQQMEVNFFAAAELTA